MAKTIEIPDALHEQLVARATAEGLSLSDYVLRELQLRPQRMAPDELLAYLDTLPPVRSELSSADLLRQARKERERELGRE
jgi:hypothetical protein